MSNSNDNQAPTFHYRFKLSNGTVRDFEIRLDPKTNNVVARPPDEPLPEWTRLSYHQCSNCPLKESESPRCPVAVNLVDVMEAFNDCLSYDVAEVEIFAAVQMQKWGKTVTLAEGIRSIMGLYMAASACPILDRLKPLARTHLPFATWDESAFRVLGTYLLAQHFIAVKGGQPDWEMRHLVAFYQQVKLVNRAFIQRLRAFCKQDAPLNAIAELDNLADMTSLLIREESLDSLQQSLTNYFRAEQLKAAGTKA